MNYNWEDFEAYVKKLLAEKKIPGAQVCVRDETGVAYQKCFGWRDEAQTKPVNDETVFGIASMSKSVTSFCLALLEQEGKVRFDDPVYRYIPDFRIPGTPREAVLIRHLCTHTTGIPPLPLLNWSMKWNTPDDPWETEYAAKQREESEYKVDKLQDIVDYIKTPGKFRPLGQPGEYMSYLNEGYALLSAIVDIVSGETLESYAQREIFDKLGMTHTTFDLSRVMANENHTNLFYEWENELKCSDNWDVAPPYRGCGWIKSTAEDMSRYYLALGQRGVFEGKQVFPAACTERMVGREFADTAKPVYCMGLLKRTFGDALSCTHTGGLKGVSSAGGFLLDDSFSVTILTNASGIDVSCVHDAAFNLRLGVPADTSRGWCKATDETLENPSMYVGTYVSNEDPDAKGVVELDEDGNLICTNPYGKMDMIFCGGTNFLMVPHGTKLTEGKGNTFLVRDGKAWAVVFGSRIYQRAAD